MKKIIFLFTLLILFTGCTVKNINDYEINEVINVSLSGYNYKPNTFYDGYKFYLPRGIKIVDKKDYNIIFDYHNFKTYIIKKTLESIQVL